MQMHLFRVTTLQTMWNSLTVPWRFAALLRSTRPVKCYSYHAHVSFTHIMLVLLSVIGVGMQQWTQIYQSIGACWWRCCSCECLPSCSVLSSPKPWRKAKIKLAQIFLAILSQVCLGRPGRRLQFLRAGDMQACRAREWSWDLSAQATWPNNFTGVWSAQYLIAVAGQYADGLKYAAYNKQF